MDAAAPERARVAWWSGDPDLSPIRSETLTKCSFALGGRGQRRVDGGPRRVGSMCACRDRFHMVARVVGEDSRGGWTRPRANSLRPLLSLSSPMEEREREREREREPGIRNFFFALYTSPRAAKRRSFIGVCDFFWFPHN